MTLSQDNSAGRKFERLVEIMARLRAPGGCPWDREQTFQTIKPYLLEETYEVLDAIDSADWTGLAEELGDLMLQAVFFAQMASDEGKFRIEDSLDAINAKLIRRHPHVFGTGTAETPDDVKRRWDEIKAEEKRHKGESSPGLLARVPRNMPALVEAQLISAKAAAAGFDWPNAEQVIEKLHEELDELAEARRNADQSEIENEIGDLLFVLVNLARFVQIDPEQALRRTNAKFRRRFEHVENRLRERGATPATATLDEMEALWQEAKGRMIEARALTTHAEFAEAVRLQRQIWGFDEVELLPVRLFVVASKVGGQVFGAFDQARMIGFCLAIPGLKPGGKTYLHSHMLGVVTEYRNAGVGRTLKLKQREEALSRSIDLIEWTFDPLEIKNAYFNMQRLGCVVRRYVLNQYGTTTSHLHGGLPTDRCVAEWWIASPRVEALLTGRALEKPFIEARVDVPVAIDRLRHDDPRQAREIQRRVSDELLESFGRGLAVVGFERTEQAGSYLLAPWPSN